MSQISNKAAARNGTGLVLAFALVPLLFGPEAAFAAPAAGTGTPVLTSAAGSPPQAAASVAPVGTSKPLRLRIVAFGSSSTQGVGASSPSAAYPAQLQVILAHLVPKGEIVEVVNRGIGGQDADDMVLRIQSDVVAQKPDIVIWQTGSNDPMRGVPLDRFESETRDGIKLMRKAGIAVILMEPQWCPRLDQDVHSGSYRELVRKIGQDMNVPVIRRADMMHRWVAEGRMTRAQMLAPDGLHMTDPGYAELARDMAPLVLQTTAISQMPVTAMSQTK